jgi:hypothetical protein
VPCGGERPSRAGPKGRSPLTGYVTVKLVWLVAVPTAVVTVMRPVAAPEGTLVTIWVAVSDTMVAGVPSNATAVAPDRLLPVMVTVVPAAPEAGVKPLTAGVTCRPRRSRRPSCGHRKSRRRVGYVPIWRRCRRASRCRAGWRRRFLLATRGPVTAGVYSGKIAVTEPATVTIDLATLL